MTGSADDGPDGQPNNQDDLGCLSPLPTQTQPARSNKTTRATRATLAAALFNRVHRLALSTMASVIARVTPTRSVDIVGTYQPLESGFNYKELGVVPKPVSAYK